MNVILGQGWKDFFDIVIVQARKPKFFTDETTPIRIFDAKLKTQLWDRVTKLEKGVIYCEVNVFLREPIRLLLLLLCNSTTFLF